MDKQRAMAFLQEHQEVLWKLWGEAREKGLDDLVFIWLVENDEEKGEGKLFARFAPRADVYNDMKDAAEVPDYTKGQLSAPAGPGKAWLILGAPTGIASMRVSYAFQTSGGSA